MQIKELKDLVYFDFSKAHSIYSQLTGGLIQQIQTALENTDNLKGEAGFNFQFLKSSIGGDSSERKTQIETKSLHHDLLNRLEQALEKYDVLIDINQELATQNDSQKVREKIKSNSYVIVEGWVTIEDYEKIISKSAEFNKIAEFIAECIATNHKELGELKNFKANLKQKKSEVNLIKDRNEKQKQLIKLNDLEKTYNNLIISLKPNFTVDEDYLEGLLNFLKVFFPKRINFRVYPDENNPSFQFFCNLKRDCFVDIDIDNFSASYGSSPNVKLTMFGLVTSLPSPINKQFDTQSEFDLLKDRNVDELEDFQKNIFIEYAFRQVFKAFENFENQVRHSRFPNVTLFPIAIYRKIKLGNS